MVSKTSSTPKPAAAAPEDRPQESGPDDIVVVKHGKDTRSPQHQSTLEPFQPSVGGFDGISGFGSDGFNERRGDSMLPWSLAQKNDPDGDTASASNALNDPELKEEIGKIVGDIIGK